MYSSNVSMNQLALLIMYQEKWHNWINQ